LEAQFPEPGGLCLSLLPFGIQQDPGFAIRTLDLSLVYTAPLHDSLLGSDDRTVNLAGWSQTKESRSISNDVDPAKRDVAAAFREITCHGRTRSDGTSCRAVDRAPTSISGENGP
jgi:hypothetical protein